jgi:hypothetical protein
MGNGKRTSGGRPSGDAFARLLAVACLGALLGWVLLPSGAGGQQYTLPTTTTPTTTTPAAVLPPLSPFPIVRIVGRTTPRGAKVTRMTVQAAGGTYVVSRCVGSAGRCPYKQRLSRIPGRRSVLGAVHVRGFERAFRAGVLLRIYVVDAGRTGKFTSFRIRSRHAPRRSDGCVSDLVLRPVRCPPR